MLIGLLSKRLNQAFFAGAIAYTISFLVCALLLMPIVSGQLDFNHTHPHNTPAHTHSISSLFAAPAAEVAFLLINFIVLLFILNLVSEKLIQSNHVSNYKSRAPPRRVF